MFLSANALAIKYGIDDRIAQFFVDREPPKENLYWKDKELYLRPKPGYIFLPLIADLFFRSGIRREILLGNEFVDTLERIGHYAAEEECGIIDKLEAVRCCRRVAEPLAKDVAFLEEVTNYLEGRKSFIGELATPFTALHRGDVFLYAICVLDIDASKFHELVSTWFALIATLLLLDDAEDFLQDQEAGDENAFIESGENNEGFKEIKALLEKNMNHISGLNSSMANTLQRTVATIWGKPGIQELLNN